MLRLLPHAAAVAAGTALALAVPFLTAYTEIDWVAYMQEVEGPMVQGDFNYEHLEGQTGPLVYPGGFVHLFALLRALTSDGKAIFRAQLIFSALHILLMVVVVFGIYPQIADLPAIAPIFAVVSRRVHSIFELRLFNDGIAMLYAYCAVALAMRNRWTLACIIFSLGVSIKMNVLLMAPGLAVLLVQANGLIGATWRVLLCGYIQFVLAAPFLYVNPLGYLKRSFDLGRVFLLKWTVNFKFLDEPDFQSPKLALALLMLTLMTWLMYGHFRWAKSSGGLFRLVLKAPWTPQINLHAEHVAVCMLESNLIGIVFARSMHYQFYAWYVHAIPLLVFRGSLGRRNFWVGLALIVVIEVAFNVFPATALSSLALQTANYALLLSCWFSPATKHVIKD